MIEPILEKALAGHRIQTKEALELFSTKDILLLGNVASRLAQEKRKDRTITYIVDRNINYTNVCITDCSFCAFYRKESDADSYVLPFETIAQKIKETLSAGGNQILLQGGHHQNLKIDYFEDLFRKIKQRFGIHLHALSPSEIIHTSRISRISLDDDKLESLSKDLASILNFVEQLNELDTKKIEPLTSIVDKTLETRIDKINDGKIKDQILKNSPDKNEEFFIVPKVVE